MVKREEMYFDSRDNINKIHAIQSTPESRKPVCIVQIIHGMAEYIERYDEFARFLGERGILVVGEDHLGHGKSVPEGGVYGYFCERDAATVVVRDSHRLKKMTQEKYPGVPYIILGHSMGSFILRNYLCRYGTGIQAAVVVGTGMQSLGKVWAGKTLLAVQKVFCGSKHPSRLMDVLSFGNYNKRVKDAKTPMDWLTKDEKIRSAYLADPMCGFIFTVNGFQTLMELVNRVHKTENLEKMPKELPVLFTAGAADPVGDYGEGVKRAYQSFVDIGMKNVGIKLYEDDRHELLNETDRAVVYEDIYQWMMSVL